MLAMRTYILKHFTSVKINYRLEAFLGFCFKLRYLLAAVFLGTFFILKLHRTLDCCLNVVPYCNSPNVILWFHFNFVSN